MYYKNKKLAKRKKKMVLKDIHLGLGYQSFIPHKLPMVASEKLVLKHSSFPPVWLRPIPDLWAGEVVSSSGVCYEAVLTGIGLPPCPTTVTITYLNKVCFVLLDLQNQEKLCYGLVPVLWEGSCRLASSAGCAWLGGCHHAVPVQMAGPIQRHIQVYAFP